MGSFKAGESITGLRSEQYNNDGLEYDFVVEQYGIVEFKPKKYENHLAQYKIRDFENKSSSGYFYVGGAEGITANGSNSYPDGWKIAMMPGTYKIIVYTDYYKDNPEPYFSMDTTFTPSSNQSPKTGTGFNGFDEKSAYIYTPASILPNTTYYDNIGFYRGNAEKLPASSSAYSVNNTMDVFTFSLSAESDVTRYMQVNNNGLNVQYPVYVYIKNSAMKNVCNDFYISAYKATTPTSDKSSSSCRLDAGDYFLEVRGSSAYDYNFKLQSTPVNTTPSCEPFYLESDKQTVKLNIGDVRYFNIKICGDVQITSSDESVAVATESKTEFITEVEVRAIADGTATITVSDKNSVGTLYITVGEATPTNPITTPDTKEVIGKITFLEYEPEGYFTWSEANTFCKERGYRLPTMNELIYVWNLNGGKISPKGFEKDTFYWSSEILTAGTNYFQGCAMDYDCSEADSWPSDSNGHPKCVVSVDGSFVNIESFKEENDGDNKKIEVTMDDKSVITIQTPQDSKVNENQAKGVTVEHSVNENFALKTTLNQDGSLLEEINTKLDALLQKTEIVIDLLIKNAEIYSDGSSKIMSETNGFTLNLFTDAKAQVTPKYSINSKNVVMPTFNSGSKVHIKQESGVVIIEVKTTLTTKLTF